MSEVEEGFEPYETEEVEPVADGVDAVAEPVADKVEETPEVEVKNEDHDEDEDEDKPKKKSGSQRAREALQREREERIRLEERLKALETGSKPAGIPATPEGKPKQEFYTTHEEWVEALTDWKVGQKLNEVSSKTEAQKAKSAWDSKVEAGRAKFEDFDDALQTADAPSTLVSKRLINEKTPVEVIYHLATHPKEYRQLNAMTDPDDVADVMAELRLRLANPEPAKPKPTTKAPAPLAPAKGSAVAVQDKDGFDAY